MLDIFIKVVDINKNNLIELDEFMEIIQSRKYYGTSPKGKSINTPYYDL